MHDDSRVLVQQSKELFHHFHLFVFAIQMKNQKRLFVNEEKIMREKMDQHAGGGGGGGDVEPVQG